MIVYYAFTLLVSNVVVYGVRTEKLKRLVLESRMPSMTAAECTKLSVPCRCTEVYPREIVIECHKATLYDVEEAIIYVSATKMQVLAIDLYSLVVSGAQYEFDDNFFMRHNAQPRALVVQDCKIKKGKHALAFAPDAFRGLEDTMVTLKVDCPMTPESLDTVRKLRALHVLQLNQLPLSRVGRLDFPQLIELDLRHDDIHDIDDDAFADTTQLEVLHLGHNNLRKVKMAWFQSTSSLKELTLPHNKIVDVEGVFKGLPNLEHLDMSHNALTQIKSNLFSSLENLKLLKLESNLLTDVRPDDYAGLANLEILSLHNNDLRVVHNNSLKALNNLKSLYLSKTCQTNDNKISPPDVDDLVLIGQQPGVDNGQRVVGDVNSALTLMSNSFAGLQRLRMLDMDCTLLYSVPSQLFANTPELRYLILANADVVEPMANDTFDNLASLTHIYLAGFDLHLLKDESIFEPMTSLKELNLITYTPALYQCRRTVPNWFENFLQTPKNFTIALPNCLPKVYQK